MPDEETISFSKTYVPMAGIRIFVPVAWAGLAASYGLFAGQVSAHEVMAGMGASVAAAAYCMVAHRTAPTPMRLRLPWFRLLGDLARALVLDTIKVGFSLFRAAPGSMTSQTVNEGFSDAGPRAVKILVLSAAPNGFVVRANNSEVLLHRLVSQ